MTAEEAKAEKLVMILGGIIAMGALLIMIGSFVFMAAAVLENPSPYAIWLHLALFSSCFLILAQTTFEAIGYKPRGITWSTIQSKAVRIRSKMIEATDWSFLTPDTFLLTTGKGEISEMFIASPIPLVIPDPPTSAPKPIVGPGFIYIMRRADGIYKIGRSTDPAARLSEHIQDYRQDFKLVKWIAVPDMAAFEGMALRMTRAYAYKKEAGRKELRKMTKRQLAQFMVEFERMVKGAN